MPKGRKPNPTLISGEGIDPYELYFTAMKALYTETKKQAVTWYLVVDVCAYDRQDQIISPIWTHSLYAGTWFAIRFLK